MRYNVWKRVGRIESEFRKALEKLADLMNKIARSAGSDQALYVERMKQFQNSYQFEKFITSAVKRMVTPIEVGNQRTWREAARKATRGRFLYRLLVQELRQGTFRIIQNQVIENVSLIRTLPEDVAAKVVHDINEEALKGRRAKSIESIIRDKTDQHARASARLIARTEVSKTQTALTMARSEQLGLRWYVWRTAMDGDRVRKSHRNMEDVLVNWNNPPSPEELVGEESVGTYHAGNIWNCRCYPEPLIEIDDVDWPHKVYMNGTIVKMKRSGFEKVM